MSSTAMHPLCPTESPRVFGAPALSTENDLLALGIAADGTLWSVEEPGLLRQWSLATRRQLNQWQLNEDATVWSFNWAGRLLASGSNEVDVWEISSGEQLIGWPAESWVTALAFQPFAPLLASGHDDGSVHLWRWNEGKRIHCFRDAHRNAVSAVAFSWDMTRLATAGEDEVIHMWDLATFENIGTLKGHHGRIPALLWHPDNRRLFSAGWDTTVRVWDTTTRQPLILLNSHATQVHAISLSGDGNLLAAADGSPAVHLWDVNKYKTVTVLRPQGGEIRVVGFTPDDEKGNRKPALLAFGGADRVISLYNGKIGQEAGDVSLSRTSVTISADGARLLCLGSSMDLRGWDVASGEPVLALEGTPTLHAFAASPDDKTVAASRVGAKDDRDTLALYDTATGAVRATCSGQRGPITALAFRSDGKQLASGGVQSCDVWLWDTGRAEPTLILPDAVDRCSVAMLAYQPGGEILAVAGIDYMATGGSDGHVVLWHPNQKKAVLDLPGGAAAIAWSPDGWRLAIATLRKMVRIHDTVNGRVVLELPRQLDSISALAYSPDGRWLATASDDRALRLWDAITGELAGAWELDSQVKALTFSPDGRTLFTGNGNTSCYQIEVEQILA